MEIVRTVTEWALPGLACPCCGTVTFAAPPPGAHAGSVSYGAVLNAAAVLLTAYGNVPPERAAQLMGMLLGAGVSAGWVDKAGSRLSALLGKAGLDEAMTRGAGRREGAGRRRDPGERPGQGPPRSPRHREEEEERDPEEKDGKAAGAPHVLIVRTPDGRLTWLQAIASRRKGDVAAGIPAAFTGSLITDGYTGYQHLLQRLAGIQQCCAHVIRRCRAVTKLGPGGLQSWAGDIIAILREAHRAAGTPAPAATPALTRSCWTACGNATTRPSGPGSSTTGCGTGTTGTTPATRSAAWLRDYREQVFLFTRDFAVDWTNNVSERGAKAAKRHQAVSGYWHSLATLARWCRIRSYLDTAAAHGIHRNRRHPRRPRRKALATATPRRSMTPIHGPP